VYSWMTPWGNPPGKTPADARAVNEDAGTWMVGAWHEPGPAGMPPLKPMPPRQFFAIAWHLRAWYHVRARLLWPYTVRLLKAAGYQRTGWRKWERR
jgi:hypothetical protein